ncbi:bifunctional 4-hydroxy-2-oxoglutarate aldolase/2-dehydro-3-deoxy-phosphogluconate aldolase [Streptomyces sp. SM14]|uniref:bifunctional 4-hydroxy-2-oxoglutarate aldolase/2-dehydro-3-deoxy-phosphogluconate aldolase n=1 Tax=Streptomyces sp. SM14 TaxID=1736045 RepID=UPI000CD528C5|nr:bifunctional 4-hydroxy-2-oxoglutarate aldolase/2-dehydro-3-deoxy-phosphogluconate aldolase [Streptomyces sp. SM14]
MDDVTSRPADDHALLAAGVIPVVTVDTASDAVPLARALVAGGLPVIEVTLRTTAAREAITRIAAEVPEAVVGAGTVRGAADVTAAVAAGARFLVGPGSTPSMLGALLDSGLPALPGVATPSEVMALLEAGVSRMKFFPAEAGGGTAWLRAVGGPLPEARFCATGGISATTAADYLRLPNVTAVGGGWMAPRDAVAAGDWGRITGLSRTAAETARAATATADSPGAG